MIETARLKLRPATIALARAEVHNRVEFKRLLGALVPDNWPPETLADALPVFLDWFEAAPHAVGWFGWYALAKGDDSDALVLVASAGFKGPPESGVAEIGYSVLPQFQGRGFATEMVRGLVGWAFGQPGVGKVVAETEWTNAASMRVLIKAGFVPTLPDGETGRARFALLSSGC